MAVDRNFQNYPNPVNSGSWHYCRPYLSDLAKTWKTLWFQSTTSAENRSLRSHLRKVKTLCFLLTVWLENRSFLNYFTKKASQAQSSVANLRCYCFCSELYRTFENTWTKTLQNLYCQFWGALYCRIFSERETLELSTDLCKITSIAKPYYNALMIIRFLFNVFPCHFSLCYVMVFTSWKQ